ncbi:hypothetical protein [Streptomyces sp. NPDC014623]|uniref:hypothetical protein n=1 Tax=Streptomyces sp. NPDC014623 TaxID=3364875 RepID=UPI0036F725CE
METTVAPQPDTGPTLPNIARAAAQHLGEDWSAEPREYAADDGGTLLGMLRGALRDGNTDLVWELSADGEQTRMIATRVRRERQGPARW